MTTVAPDRDVVSPDDLEALIKEARDHQRRRRRRVALAILAVGAGGFGVSSLGGGGTSHPPSSATASPGAIGAFLARADRALNGQFAVSYEVRVPGRRGALRRARVLAAQFSRGRTFYREMPSFSALPRSRGYEVFSGPNGDPSAVVSCAQERASSPWSCVGPYEGIGMGTTFQLQGPYPPQALVLGLDNAKATYTGRMATKPEPAFLLWRGPAGHQLRCLEFGQALHPIGSVCLNVAGVIAAYDLPQAVTLNTYRTATLSTYSPHVNSVTLSLPATPKPDGSRG